MQIARISSKGQLIIPQHIRKKLNIETGSLFAIASNNDILILKKLKSLPSKADIKTSRIVGEAWHDIEQGRCSIMSLDEFTKQAGKW